MKFLRTLFAAAAIATSAIAAALPQGAVVDGPNIFTTPSAAGVTLNTEGVVNIAWTPGPPGTVSLWLTKGKEGAMMNLQPIVAGIPNTGAYSWTPPKELQDSTTITNGEQYGFRIVDDSGQATNFSPPFHLSIPGSTFQAEPVPAPVASSAPAAVPTEAGLAQSSATPVGSAAPTDAASLAPSATSSAAPSAVTSAAATTAPATSATTTTAPASSTSSAPVSDAPETQKGPNIGLIIGAIFGAVAGIGLAAVALMIFLKKRKEHQREKALQQLDREHALQRVSEVQREWMSQYDNNGNPNGKATTENGHLSVNGEKNRRASSFMGTAF